MRNVIFFILFVSPIIVTSQCVKGDCANGKGKYKFKNGSIYFGQFRGAQLHGTGTMRYANGDVYSGQWKENKRDGGGKLERANGNVYEGKFVGNKLNGKGRLIYSSKDRYVGTFVESIPNGKGKIFFKNGNRYEGDVVSSKMDGVGRMEYKNGDMYYGGWKANKKHGQGMFQWASGKSVEGFWVEGKRDKSQKTGSVNTKSQNSLICTKPKTSNHSPSFAYHDGTTYVGQMQQGRPHGEGTVYYVNGDRYEGGWKNHAPDGYGIMHFANGFKYACNWENGKPGNAINQNRSEITKQKYLPVKNSEEVKIYAMVIGIASYNHMPTLRFTDDDAYHFYAFLKSPEGGAVPDEQISLLIDDSATKQKILDEMQNLFRKADENDVVLMYYSGHGLQGSFIPSDYDGYNNTLAHDDIIKIFDNSNAKHKICIADACHSGSLYASRSMTSALDDYYSGFDLSEAGTALMVSSKSEELSLEYSGLRQGVFSHFLIRGLKGEANINGDELITISELYDFINLNVREYTGNYQHPSISGNYDPQMPIALVR